jgi:hypothetical protein
MEKKNGRVKKIDSCKKENQMSLDKKKENGKMEHKIVKGLE